MDFVINEIFSSFEEVQGKVEKYSKKTYVEARTIESAIKSKRISEDRMKNKTLKYYELKYVCIHGCHF